MDVCQALPQDTPSHPLLLLFAPGPHGRRAQYLLCSLQSTFSGSGRVNTSYLCFQLPSPNPPDSKPPSRAILRPKPSPCWSLLLQHIQKASLQATHSKLWHPNGWTVHAENTFRGHWDTRIFKQLFLSSLSHVTPYMCP